MKIEVYSPTIRRKEMDAVLTALVEDKIGPGEQSKLLIHSAREKLSFDYCAALRSPAIALYMALKSLDLRDGQGVALSALSPLYYVRVLEDLRLKPLYCDVLPSAAYMGRETIEAAVRAKSGELEVRAVILHHTLGYFPDGAAVAGLGIPVIEDCSQSYGTVYGEEKAADGSGPPAGAAPPASYAGSSGVFTILGLEERDMLTSGGGALLYASNRRDGAVLRGLGDLPPEYGLPDMNAAMAVVQFRESAKNLAKRAEIARVYNQSALRTRHQRFIQHDVSDKAARNEGEEAPRSVEYNNFSFPLILETGMKDVKAYARRKDIAVESAFEHTPVGLGMAAQEDCPEAYSLSLRTVLFPLYPRLGVQEIERVSKLILTLP
ncbi:MAG: DegT/DnrJ/EryC1/StrS family aminotransferase [Treponema sp.]|jgi:dTDP-4-amino-4,6-dideoxygalactose transaminase|nr:DegT/DnrJ/EryC1/StrS family aminotransferase [Treponema sp.]